MPSRARSSTLSTSVDDMFARWEVSDVLADSLEHEKLILTSWRKSAMPFLGGSLKPRPSKKLNIFSLGPKNTTWPSARRSMSSKSSKVSGAGCRRAMSTVPSNKCTKLRMHFTIWKVVILSNPVEISSINRVFFGPTTISPVESSAHHFKNVTTFDATWRKFLQSFQKSIEVTCCQITCISSNLSTPGQSFLWINYIYFKGESADGPGALIINVFNEWWALKYIFSPVVTRFFWPPEIPRSMSFPTSVSAQNSRPSTFMM